MNTQTKSEVLCNKIALLKSLVDFNEDQLNTRACVEAEDAIARLQTELNELAEQMIIKTGK